MKRYPKPEYLSNYTPVFRPMPLDMDVSTHETWQSVCVVMPKPLIPYLLGVMEIYRWHDRVVGTDSERLLFASLWRAFMAHIAEAEECEDGFMFKLRQNPETKCHLEQSFDGGATWTLAFDYSKCQPRMPRPSQFNLSLSYQIYNDASQTWNEWNETTNISEINTSITNIYGGEQSEPNLCWAVVTLVTWVKDMLIEAKELELDGQAEDASIVGALALAVRGIMLAGKIISWKVALLWAIGEGIGNIIFGYVQAYSLDEIKASDILAVSNVIYCELLGKETSYEQCSIAETSSVIEGVELELYETVASLFNATHSEEKLRFWQSWVNALGESRNVGLESDICVACAEPEPPSGSNYITFVNSEHYEILNGSLDEFGNPAPSAFASTDDVYLTGGVYEYQLIVRFNPTISFNRIAFDYNYDRVATQFGLTVLNAGGGQIFHNGAGYGSTVKNAWHRATLTVSAQSAGAYRIRIYMRSFTPFTAHVYLDNVEFYTE